MRSRSALLVAGLAVFAAALAGLLVTGHTAIRPSTDSDALIRLVDVLVPLLLGMLLVRLVPPRVPRLEPMSGVDRTVVTRQAWQAVAIAVGLPVLVYAAVLLGAPTEVSQTAWVVAKPLVFLFLPWLLYRGTWRTPPDLWRPQDRWRWLGPLPALAAFAVLTIVGPFAGPRPDAADYPDPVVLAIGATITFLTANVIEELFYRVTLQSRLEALLGRWPAIVSASLLFALLHLPTHAQTDDPVTGLPLTLAAIVIFQGASGLFLGYLWSRYRNVWYQFAVHSVINTLPLVLL